MEKEKKIIIGVSIVLSLLGLFMIYSSSYVWSEFKFGNKYHYALYQGIFLLIGLVIYRLILNINLDFIKKNINKLLLVGIIMLILVSIPGIGVLRNGSRSWFKLGPFSFQPSEFIKIVLIIFTSKYLEKYHTKINNIKSYLLPILFMLFFIILLIMLEPDFGSSFIIISTIALMIFISGLKSKIILYSVLFALFGFAGLIIAAPYRVLRIISFINPWSDPLGSGYQIIQSLYAISPGGLFGQGLFLSRQKHFYLPEPQTDFIFSIICEELGIITAVLILILFFLLIYNIFKVSYKQSNLFYKFLSFGIGAVLSVQTLINLSVVVGNIPVTGVTLPFFSYGGSSLITTIVCISIIINIINRTNV